MPEDRVISALVDLRYALGNPMEPPVTVMNIRDALLSTREAIKALDFRKAIGPPYASLLHDAIIALRDATYAMAFDYTVIGIHNELLSVCESICNIDERDTAIGIHKELLGIRDSIMALDELDTICIQNALLGIRDGINDLLRRGGTTICQPRAVLNGGNSVLCLQHALLSIRYAIDGLFMPKREA